MKKQILFAIAGCFSGLVSGQTILISENFDSYTVGEDITTIDPTNWAVWAPGEGAPISTNQAYSPSNSLGLIASAAAGGPGDLLLLLGDKTTGSYALSWQMYVPSGKGGYFNIQHSENVAVPSFAAEVIFANGGTLDGMANNVAITGTYPQDAWFQVSLLIDLTNVTAYFLIDATPIATWPFNTITTGAAGPNQLGAIDFYAYGGGAPTVGEYYLDDLLYLDLTTTNVPEVATAEVGVYPNPAVDMVTVDLPTLSGEPTASLVDVTGRVVIEGRSFQQQGAIARAQLSLAGLPEGMYFVRIQDGDREIVRRVMKH